MKKLKIIITLFLLSFSFSVTAQTSTELTPTIATSGLGKVLNWLAANPDLLSTNRQWTFIPYASRAKGLLDANGEKAEWGGGVAALYPLNSYVRAGFRMQYFAGDWYMPSVNVQIQSVYSIAGTKATWSPSVFSGVSSPAGGSSQNGDIGTLYGAGLSVRFPVTDKVDVGVGYAVETWSNLKVDKVEHLGLFLTIHF